MSCTRNEQLEGILQQCENPPAPSHGHEIRANVTDIWGSYADDCTMIRTPELVKTPNKLLVFGQCRHANASNEAIVSDGPEIVSRLGLRLGDDMLSVRMVTVESTDNGKTWGKIKVVSDIARSVGVGIYDRRDSTIVFQYQSFTQTNPYAGNALLQKVSTDEGETWGIERDITHFIAQSCNSGPGGQVCGAAGSRLQTVSGRLVFSGHNKASSTAGTGICVWFSDDGGQTYQTSATGVFQGNEQSIADLGNGTLYMNGRGTTFPWKGHRTSYWSHDNGLHWSAGVEARHLQEPNTFGCDGSLIAVPNREPATPRHAPPRVFFAEPSGPSERISLRVWCSTDGGLSFPKYIGINKGAGAGYSALQYVEEAGKPMLVVVWEGSVGADGTPYGTKSTGTMWSYRLTIDDWCPEVAGIS